MDSATFYVAYAPHSPWEWGWDAWVAIGTLALAVTTMLAVVVPLISDYRKKQDEATRLATLFDHELHMLCGFMIARADATTDAFRTPNTFREALQAVYYLHSKIGVPILEKLVDRLGVFETKTAMDLGAALTGVMQMQRNPPPQEFETGAISYETGLRFITSAFAESVSIARAAHRARVAIRPKIGRVVQMPALDPLPRFISEAWAESVESARARPANG